MVPMLELHPPPRLSHFRSALISFACVAQRYKRPLHFLLLHCAHSICRVLTRTFYLLLHSSLSSEDARESPSHHGPSLKSLRR